MEDGIEWRMGWDEGWKGIEDGMGWGIKWDGRWKGVEDGIGWGMEWDGIEIKLSFMPMCLESITGVVLLERPSLD